MAAHFVPPVVQNNPDGWGPCEVSTTFKGIPYQPFSKGDRIGKISDWTGQFQDRNKFWNKYQSQFAGGNQYAYYHENDESTFQLVDTSKPQKTAYQKNRQRFNNARLKREREKQQRSQAFMMGQSQQRGKQQRKNQKNFHHFRRWNDRQQNQKPRDASVLVGDKWKVVEEMDFPRLSKLKLPDVPEPVDLYTAGTLEMYDKLYDRVTTKNERPLETNKRTFHRVTTTDDPIIRKLAGKGNVFGTDAIISTLMCCTRSTQSWDIIVQKVGSKIFFDKRDNSNFDLLPVYETTQEEMKEEGINCPANLAVEATYINQNFSQQCLKKGESIQLQNPNPFADKKDEVASIGYKYRKFSLGSDINVVIRCEHDGVLVTPNGEKQYLNIKALNEFDPRTSKIDWRQKLDSQIGSCLATELKNNSCKMAKWTCNAILAGTDILKFGYVSRYALNDPSRHVILGTQQFKPKVFAQQIVLDMDNAWGILRCIVDRCMQLSDGKYLLLRDPNRGVLLLYDIPDDSFQSDGESDESSDEDEK